jgi:hypothetical protein
VNAEQIAAEIADRLATRTVALGAETNLGVKVYRGRTRIHDDMIPCSVVIEGDDVVARERGVGPTVKIEQRYVLMAYVPCDPDHPNDAAHKALRDLKRAIFVTAGKPDATWGRKVKDVEYLGRDIGPRADGAAFVLAVIEIAVEFPESLAAP